MPAVPHAALPAVRPRDPDQSLVGEKTLPTEQRWPYQVVAFVEWCGHQQEVVLVPEGDGWYSEIPVVGVAR